jgi:hypothetical protein
MRIGLLLTILIALAFEPAHAQKAVCSGTTVPIDTSLGLAPFLRLQTGNQFANVLVDTGANGSSVDPQIFSRGFSVGSQVDMTGMFPTIESWNVRVRDQGNSPGPQGSRQDGTIGTDILSQRTVEFHYDDQRPYMVVSAEPCAPRTFEDAGFLWISQTGYYSADRRRSRDNLPVVFLRIGPETVPAWIDSGLKLVDGNINSKRGIVFVNIAMLQRLRNAGIQMKPQGTAINRDCNGRHARFPMFQVEGISMSLRVADGGLLFNYGPPLLEVVSASDCGGIGQKQEPWAMIGALYLLRWGTTIFDAYNERLWVSRSRGSAAPEPPYRAMALAWNVNGGWMLRTAANLATASSLALSACNSQNRNCRISASVGPYEFACLAIARNTRGKLFSLSGKSLDNVRNGVMRNCLRDPQGGSCRVLFSPCND